VSRHAHLAAAARQAACAKAPHPQARAGAANPARDGTPGPCSLAAAASPAAARRRAGAPARARYASRPASPAARARRYTRAGPLTLCGTLFAFALLPTQGMFDADEPFLSADAPGARMRARGSLSVPARANAAAR
jgi:hypothetical protein